MSNTTKTNTAIQIISRHASLGEAVAASGMDLSYNEAEAKRTIANTERGHRMFGTDCKSGEAFVTSDGVYFLYRADIRLLNKFEPFSACLDNSNFAEVTITDTEIRFSKRILPKTPAMRKLIAQSLMIVG